MFLHKKLRQARKKKDLSMEDVVHLVRVQGLKITRQSLTNWELGVYSPTAEYLSALSKVLSVNVEYFFKQNKKGV